MTVQSDRAPLPTPVVPTPVVTPPGPTPALPLPPTPAVVPGAAPEIGSSPTPILLPTMPPPTIAGSAEGYPAPPPTALPPTPLPPTPHATLPPELGRRGDTWAVLFSPGGVAGSEVAGQLIMDNFIEYIDAAQTSIDLAVYEMNLTPIAEALIRAHNRGVVVRFVTDNEGGLEADSDEDGGQFAMLQAAGIEVRPDTRSALMHNKFIVIDDTIFITGSTNLTVNDLFENNNNAVAAAVPEVAAIYKREVRGDVERRVWPQITIADRAGGAGCQWAAVRRSVCAGG